MKRIVFYTKLNYDRDETHPPAFYGSPSSAEIHKIADALGTDYDLGDGELCPQCSEYELKRSSFDKRSSSGADEHVLSTIDRDTFVFRCALCQLVRRVLEPDFPEEYRIEDGADRFGSCLWFRSNSEGEHPLLQRLVWRLVWKSDEGILEVDDPPPLRRLHVSLRLEDGTEIHQSSHAIEPFSLPGASNILLGRVFAASKIDPDLIRMWIRCCDDWHQGECKSSFRNKLPHPAAELRFYAVDVVGMRLVLLSPEETYCTLSYVWGSTKHFELKKADIEALKQPGGFSKVFDQLPSTIKDAIELTKELGFLYLWVDCVCLPQDDNTAMEAAFKRMHLVYSKAALNIVGASGDHVDVGLPGFRDDTRKLSQAVRRIGASDLILGIQPRFQWSLYHSPHGQRAWT